VVVGLPTRPFFRRGDRFLGKAHTLARRAGPPRPAFPAFLAGAGLGSTPEELAALLTAETEKWQPVIKQAHIALD